MLPLHSIRDGRCTCRRDCGRNAGKHPCTHNGKDDASTDAEQVAAWWTRWPWANVGIRPPVGVVVLDVDPRHNGAAALLALTQRHAPLPATLTAWTGGGGLHVWLAYAGPARGALCPGGAVDVKTDHGYVVAPPSLHASGQRYAWANDLPTAPAPRWVRHLLNPPRPQGHYHPNTAAAGGSDAGLVRAVAGAVEGTRNSVLHWAACRAHERSSDPALLHELIAAATAVGLPESEARKTVQSAARNSLAGAA